MYPDKEPSQQPDKAADGQQQEEPLHLKNPFKPDDDKEITQEELEKEQEFKEALTERD